MESNNNQEQKNPSTNKKSTLFGGLLATIVEFLKVAIIAAIIVLPIRYFLFQPFVVKGESMVPNFQNRDYLIVDEISYRFTDPQRGDIVVFKPPDDPGQRYIKRIIGLPGETVVIDSGKVEILKNGKTLDLNEKKYLPDLTGTQGNVNITLGVDQYFVLGDNRLYSFDSRFWTHKALPKANIIGRVFLRVLPVTSISNFPAPSYSN